MPPALKSSDIYAVIVGTAGHIDHGKSTLVTALTGVQHHRLKEEKELDGTVDLGFAPFALKDGRRIGIIDVPGHERFIKNMVAGATSIDVVLLVVAGDEGPNLQTREHVTIMQLLGLKRGIIVLTKLDKADPDFVDLVKEDVKSLVQGTFLESSPVVGVSSVSGQGMPELVDTINRVIATCPAHEAGGVFRMPIQRVFSAKGFGTVVTGVPVSGVAKIGDTLEILPLGVSGRIRNLQAYKSDVTEIRAGHSSAVAITDVDYQQVSRGMVAAAPGYFRASTFVEARFRYVPDIPRPLRNLAPVKLHTGTKEADGRIVLLDKKSLEPGEECFVQFRLDEPVVVAAGDPYIVRMQTPTYTIGGGRVLDASDQKLKPFKDENLMRLVEKEAAMSDRFKSLELVLKEMGRKAVDVKEFAQAAKSGDEAAQAALAAFESSGRIVRFDGGKFMHIDALEATMQFLKSRVEQFHQKNPLRAGLELLVLRNESKLDETLFQKAFGELTRRGVLAVEAGKARLAGFAVKLSPQDAEAAVEVERTILQGRFSTPRIDELYARYPKYNKERIDRVLGLLVDRGAVARLKDDVLMHRETVEEAKKLVGDAIRKSGAIEAAQMRDVLGTSRKYIIPLLEHLDDVGFTQRVENKRVLRKQG